MWKLLEVFPVTDASSSGARTPGLSWEAMKPHCFAFGGKNEGRSDQRTYRPTSSSSLAWRPNPSIGAGSSAIPGKPSKAFNIGADTR